jgi:hypothetical protein
MQIKPFPGKGIRQNEKKKEGNGKEKMRFSNKRGID